LRNAQTIEERQKAQAKLDSLRELRKKQPLPMTKNSLAATAMSGAMSGLKPQKGFIPFGNQNNSVNTLQDAQNFVNKMYGDK